MIKSRIVACFLASAFLFVFLVGNCLAVDPATAWESVSRAEGDLSSAYVAVADAERAGANVSELVARLELAADSLGVARNSFEIGDWDGAYSEATNCSNTVEGVFAEASALESDAERVREETLLFTAGLSSVGLCLLLAASLFSWRLLRSRYVMRVLKMKPEVEGSK